MTTSVRKKLVEVSIPLEAINVASAREKSIRHGHPLLPISAKIWAAFFDSTVALGVRKDGVAASAGGAAGRAALVEEGWLAGAFLPVERRGASGQVASSGQRRGRVIEPVRQRLDQKGQEKMGQNPRLCGALIEAWRFF